MRQHDPGRSGRPMHWPRVEILLPLSAVIALLAASSMSADGETILNAVLAVFIAICTASALMTICIMAAAITEVALPVAASDGSFSPRERGLILNYHPLTV